MIDATKSGFKVKAMSKGSDVVFAFNFKFITPDDEYNYYNKAEDAEWLKVVEYPWGLDYLNLKVQIKERIKKEGFILSSFKRSTELNNIKIDRNYYLRVKEDGKILII